MKRKKSPPFLFFVAIWVLVNWMMSLEGQKTIFASLAFHVNLFKPSSTWIPNHLKDFEMKAAVLINFFFFHRSSFNNYNFFLIFISAQNYQETVVAGSLAADDFSPRYIYDGRNIFSIKKVISLIKCEAEKPEQKTTLWFLSIIIDERWVEDVLFFAFSDHDCNHQQLKLLEEMLN